MLLDICKVTLNQVDFLEVKRKYNNAFENNSFLRKWSFCFQEGRKWKIVIENIDPLERGLSNCDWNNPLPPEVVFIAGKVVTFGHKKAVPGHIWECDVNIEKKLLVSNLWS